MTKTRNWRKFELLPCKQCKKPMQPRDGEHATTYERRSFCNKRCQGGWLKAHGTGIYSAHLDRIREVLRRDPDLEVWQIAERFGIQYGQASQLRQEVLRKRSAA